MRISQGGAMRWTAIIHHYLLYGQGQSIYALAEDAGLVEALTVQAMHAYTGSAYIHHHVPRADFVPLYAGKLATRQYYPEHPDHFSSLQDVAVPLASHITDAVLIHIHNAVALSGQDWNDAEAILQGFESGGLLHTGQDEDRLHEMDIAMQVPGVLRSFILRGVSSRLAHPSFKREMRLEAQYQEQHS
ncbi:MAG: hypothetical protein AB7F82_05765 [Alphaproteobacteria bacterium]